MFPPAAAALRSGPVTAAALRASTADTQSFIFKICVYGGSYFPALHLENIIMGRGRPEVNRSEVFRHHFTPLTSWTKNHTVWPVASFLFPTTPLDGNSFVVVFIDLLLYCAIMREFERSPGSSPFPLSSRAAPLHTANATSGCWWKAEHGTDTQNSRSATQAHPVEFCQYMYDLNGMPKSLRVRINKMS